MARWSKQAAFVLLSAADLALTCWLLERSGGHVYEANPVAGWWLARHGAVGLACFKAALMAVVLALAALIARHRPRAAGRILGFGCATLAAVVLYSATLCREAALSPEQRAARADQELDKELDALNRDMVDKLNQRKDFLAWRKALCEEVIAGRCTFQDALNRLVAAEKARNRDFDLALLIFYPEGSPAERYAAYLLWQVVRTQEEKPEAAWRIALRIEHELEAAYGRSPRKHRELLPNPPPSLAHLANEAI
jgi:hypothetical protein